MRTLAAAAVAALLAGSLSACGAPAEDTATDPSGDGSSPAAVESTPADDSSQSPADPVVKPASGPELAGRGFAFRVPKGWADVTADAPDGVLASAVNLTEDDVPDMVVVRAVTTKASVGALASAAADDLAAHGARKVSRGEPAEVAGLQAAHVSALSDDTGGPARLERYDVVVAGKAYAITFSTSKWKTAERRQAMIDAILASWRWS